MSGRSCKIANEGHTSGHDQVARPFLQLRQSRGADVQRPTAVAPTPCDQIEADGVGNDDILDVTITGAEITEHGSWWQATVYWSETATDALAAGRVSAHAAISSPESADERAVAFPDMGEQRGAISATDLMAELEADPEFVARREAADARRATQAAARRQACGPAVADLASNGVHVESLWDLYKQPESYPQAIPVLLAHLQRDYPERTLEDIGRALPFKPDAVWWGEFKDLYLTTHSHAVRDRLAAAMSQCAVRKHYDDLLTFIQNEDLGESRIYFLHPINRIGNRLQAGEGRAVIEQLADHPVLGIEATRILQGRSRGE